MRSDFSLNTSGELNVREKRYYYWGMLKREGLALDAFRFFFINNMLFCLQQC